MLLNLDVHEAMTPANRKSREENTPDLDHNLKKSRKSITETILIERKKVTANKKDKEVAAKTNKKSKGEEVTKMKIKANSHKSFKDEMI